MDFDEQVAELLRPPPHLSETHPPIAEGPIPDSNRALSFLAQILYAYLYEDRMSLHDPTPESAWTVVKLSRSLACWTDPLEGQLDLRSTLIFCFRRSLVYPLYRSTAVCAKICHDAATLLSASPRARILHVLHALDEWFALAPTGTGLAEQVTTVLSVVWEQWIAPLATWVAHAATDAHFHQLHVAFANIEFTPKTLVEIGTPGGWDLAALNAAAEEARAEGEGEWV